MTMDSYGGKPHPHPSVLSSDGFGRAGGDISPMIEQVAKREIHIQNEAMDKLKASMEARAAEKERAKYDAAALGKAADPPLSTSAERLRLMAHDRIPKMIRLELLLLQSDVAEAFNLAGELGFELRRVEL